MERVRSAIKEIYQQVGEYEFNRINPYSEMLKAIRNEYPEAQITKCTTEIIVVPVNGKCFQVPALTMYYTI